MNFLSFILSSFVIIILPGTGVIYTISTALLRNGRSSLFAALGCTLGIVPHLLISVLFSSFLQNANHIIFVVIQIIGILYLLYLGIGMIIAQTPDLQYMGFKGNYLIIIRQGILINLLNPKLSLFFLSFLPQYLNSSSNSYILQSLILGALFMFFTLVIFVLYGILANAVKNHLISSPKRMKKIQIFFGIVFIGFAVNLLLQMLKTE